MKRIPAWVAGTGLWLLFAPATHAEKPHPRAGSSSASFLRIGVGARAAGMADAYSAVADDFSAMYWNPAGLSMVRSRSLGYSHVESFQGVRHSFGGYAHPIRSGAWGFGVTFQSVPGDIEMRLGLNETDPLNPITQPEGTFGAYDLALGISHGRPVGIRHSLGGTVKFIHQSIANHAAETAALDLGWQWRSSLPGWAVGAAILNLGPGVKFQSRKDLPLTWRGGAAYRLERQRLRLGLDIAAPRDNYPLLAFGIEAGPWSRLILRTGYQYRWHGNPGGNVSGYRAGVGFAAGNVSIDYAIAPFLDMGIENRFTLAWRFSQGSSATSAAPTAAARQPTSLEPINPGTPAAAALPQQQVQAIPEPPQPLDVPVQVALPEGGPAMAFSVATKVLSLSEAGGDLEVSARAPSKILDLKSLSLRVKFPQMAEFALEASEIPAAAVGNLKVAKAYRLRLSPRAATQSGSVVWRAEAQAVEALFGFWAGKWRRLEAEAFEDEGEKCLRASFERMPEALAAAAGP